MLLRPAATLALAALLLSTFGCFGCSEAPTPEASLRAFIAAASAGDHDTAWKGLSRETRESAEALVAGVREGLLAAGEVPPADGKALIFGSGLEMVRAVERIEELSRTETRAKLRVTDPSGGAIELEMRKEDGQWHLHLPLGDAEG